MFEAVSLRTVKRREPSAPGARPSSHFGVRLAKALEIISKPAGVREVKRRERRAPDLREAS